MRSAALFDRDREGPRGGRRRGGGRADGDSRRQQARKEEDVESSGHDDRMGEGSGRIEDSRRGRRGSGRGRGRGGRGDVSSAGGGSAGNRWEYLDPEGQTRGPFPSEAMLNWRKAGYFHEDLPVRLAGAADFSRLRVVVPAMKKDCGQPMSPGSEERRVRGRGAAGTQNGPGRGHRQTGEPGDWGNLTHPAEVLAGDDGNRRMESGRGGQRRDRQHGRGPRRGQEGHADYQEDGEGRHDRRLRENRPREANRSQAPANGSLGYPPEVARRLFTAEAPFGAEEPVWRYIDLSGDVQGPFHANQMLDWYQKGHLNKMDLMVCGTERKVSPPDLPNPAIHFQEFGYLLGLVQAGSRFKPLTPKQIEDGTLPNYTTSYNSSRGNEGRGERQRRDRSEGGGRGPRPEGRGRPERSDQRERGPRDRSDRPPRRERNGRGERRLQEAPGRGGEVESWDTRAPAQGGSWDNIATLSDAGPGVERGGRRREQPRRPPRERRERKPRQEEQPDAGDKDGEGRSQRNRRERRPRKEGVDRSEAGDKIEVELKAVEDGLIKLTISPAKAKPPSAKRGPPRSAKGSTAEAAQPSTKGWGASTDAAPDKPGVGDWGAIQEAEAAGETVPSAKGAHLATDIETSAVPYEPLEGSGERATDSEALPKVPASAEEVAPLLEKPADNQDATGKAVAAGVSDILKGGAAETPQVESATSEEVKPLLQSDTIAAKFTDSNPSEDQITESKKAAAASTAAIGTKPDADLAAEAPAVKEAAKEPLSPLSDKVPGTQIAPGHPGEAGTIGEKELEKKSAMAEEASGVEALEPVDKSAKEGIKGPVKTPPTATDAHQPRADDDDPDLRPAADHHFQPSKDVTEDPSKTADSAARVDASPLEAPQAKLESAHDSAAHGSQDAQPDLPTVLKEKMEQVVSIAQEKSLELIHQAEKVTGVNEPTLMGKETEDAPPLHATKKADYSGREEEKVPSIKEPVPASSGSEGPKSEEEPEKTVTAKKKGGLLSSLIGRFESK